MRARDTTTETHAARTLSHRGTLRLTGAGLTLIAVCYGLARFAYGLFVPNFRAEFALDAATAGVIASGSYASYCVAIVVSMLLTPRFGSRILAISAGTIATAGVLLIAAAPNALVLAVGVFVAGSSTGAASPPLAHAVAHTVRPSVRDRTQTVVNAGTGLGVAIAGPIALLTHEHWRAAWLLFAALCALATVWAAKAVPAGPSGSSGRGSVHTLLPRPLLPAGSAKLIASAALMGAASSAVWTFGRDVLVSAGGMSRTASTIAWILLGVLGVLGAAAGDLTIRFGIRTGWMAAMLILGIATGLLACVPSSAWIAAAAFGAGYIALTGLLLIWGTAVYPRAPAAGVGLAFLAIALGQSAGAPLVGALTEIMGARTAFIAAALVALTGAFIRPKPQ